MNTAPGIHARLQLARADFTLDVALDLPARGITALFGASGSGKTTCLRAIAGLERASGGQVSVLGEVWQDDAARVWRPPHRRALGYVFQEASLFAHLSVRGNVTFGLQRVPPAQHRIALEQAVELLGIGALMDRLPATLSGGERQRVGLARALVADATLLLVDEPLSALDPTRAAQALVSLTQAAREQGATLVATLHHVEMALLHFPRIVGLRGGELAFDLPADQVTPQRLRDLYAQHLDELSGPAPASFDAPPGKPVPAVMHCR